MQNGTKVGAVLFVICIALMIASGYHFKGYGNKSKWIKVCAPIGFVLGLGGLAYGVMCLSYGDAMFSIETAKTAVNKTREGVSAATTAAKTAYNNRVA